MKKSGIFILLFFLLLAPACKKNDSEVPTNAQITLTGFSDCIDFFNTKGVLENQPPDKSCIEYTYAQNTLLLTHYNAGFNCCPDGFMIELNSSGDTLIITESENDALCNCNCLFNLEFQIDSLPAGNYVVRMVEPYLSTGDPKLEFSIDLNSQNYGIECVSRTNYPWGIN